MRSVIKYFFDFSNKHSQNGLRKTFQTQNSSLELIEMAHRDSLKKENIDLCAKKMESLYFLVFQLKFYLNKLLIKFKYISKKAATRQNWLIFQEKLKVLRSSGKIYVKYNSKKINLNFPLKKI